MTDIEGFLTIYGHSDNLLNNNVNYYAQPIGTIVKISTQRIFERNYALASEVNHSFYFF